MRRTAGVAPGHRDRAVVDRVALLGVPSSAGTHGPGQERAPAALRAAGLVPRLEAAGVRVTDHGDLPQVRFRPDPAHRDRQSIDAVVGVVRAVADALPRLLDSGAVPVVLGGDCTVTLGVLAALVDRWPDTGLLYFDGDLDLSVPASTVSGILDTMVLAHVLGEGDDDLLAAGPRTPLLPADRVVAFGHDPHEESPAARARRDHYRLRTHPSDEVCGRSTDPVAAAAAAWGELRRHAGPVLLHFDVDVIDSTDLPLANFPHFNEGLPARVALECLGRFCASPGLAGLVVTEVNPDRDPDGRLVDRLVNGLVDALAGPGRHPTS